MGVGARRGPTQIARRLEVSRPWVLQCEDASGAERGVHQSPDRDTGVASGFAGKRDSSLDRSEALSDIRGVVQATSLSDRTQGSVTYLSHDTYAPLPCDSRFTRRLRDRRAPLT